MRTREYSSCILVVAYSLRNVRVHLGANVYGKSRAFVRAHYQNRVREPHKTLCARTRSQMKQTHIQTRRDARGECICRCECMSVQHIFVGACTELSIHTVNWLAAKEGCCCDRALLALPSQANPCHTHTIQVKSHISTCARLVGDAQHRQASVHLASPLASAESASAHASAHNMMRGVVVVVVELELVYFTAVTQLAVRDAVAAAIVVVVRCVAVRKPRAGNSSFNNLHIT